MLKTVASLLLISGFFWASAVQAANAISPLPKKEFAALKKYQTHIQAALKKATPEQADKLLVQYISKFHKMQNAILRADQHFLNKQMAQHVKTNYHGQIIYHSPALQSRNKQAAQYGLDYQYYPPVGNGYIRTSKTHYRELFGDKVSPAVRAYLQIREQQYDEDLFHDQEMTMPYDKVGERVITWERYLNKYGQKSALLNHAKCEYILNQSAFLTGGYIENREEKYGMGISGILTNFSDQPSPKQEKLKPEVRKAWRKYQQKYPKSASSLLIAKMPKKAPFQDPAQLILDNYHKKVGLYALSPKKCETLWF